MERQRYYIYGYSLIVDRRTDEQKKEENNPYFKGERIMYSQVLSEVQAKQQELYEKGEVSYITLTRREVDASEYYYEQRRNK